MKILLNPNLAPPGGWRFVDPDTKQVFSSDTGRYYTTLQDLVSHVQRYREQNGYPEMVNLQIVIEDWLCQQLGDAQKRYCKDLRTGDRTIKQYAKGMLAAGEIMLKRDESLVPAAISEKRAAICVGCEFNQVNEKHSKTRRYTDTYVQRILGLPLKTSHDKKLFSCSICTCPLRTKVHVAQELVERYITPQERGRFPSFCWQTHPVTADAEVKSP